MSAAENNNLESLLDVKVAVTVRLGSCRMAMRDVLSLQPGAVLQLQQHAKDPVGIYIKDKLIGFGEVVVVEDNLGIKITELSNR